MCSKFRKQPLCVVAEEKKKKTESVQTGLVWDKEQGKGFCFSFFLIFCCGLEGSCSAINRGRMTALQSMDGIAPFHERDGPPKEGLSMPKAPFGEAGSLFRIKQEDLKYCWNPKATGSEKS